MELIDVFDENLNLKRTQIRDDLSIKQGDFVKVVHIFIENNNKKFLIQKRSANKKIKPNEFDITTGTLKHGENLLECAKREVFEELSIKADKKDFKFLGCVKAHLSFLYLYYLKKDFDVKNLKFQKEEVSLIEMLDEKNFLTFIEKIQKNNKEYINKVKMMLKER
ncbi:MAG: NUDIX domain-containing protein [Peptoniphilaceae bacterium]|nr:NUDIX domain-containing protein [Peptoniphilaceae bacterium]